MQSYSLKFKIIFSALFFAAVFLLPKISRAAIPSTLGWYEVPNTNLQSVCPPNNFGGTTYPFSSFCNMVTEAWNSGVFDTARNRLIIWGGGHNDYYGNEVYAINLNTLSVSRLTDPGLPLASSCTESIVNGTQPNSRHTYDGLAYLPNLDKMFAFGGALSCPPSAGSNSTWFFDFSTNTWEKKNPTGTIPSAPASGVSATAYDPNANKVFIHDTNYLYSYDVASNSYQRLSGYEYTDYHLTGVVDPVRKKFILLGNGEQWIYDISSGSSYIRQSLGSTGGSVIVNGNYPGLAYDPVTDRIVAWSGGNTVYSLNLDTKVWTPITYSGGPGAALTNGTYKRWSYSPASGVFVVYNSVDANVYTFRLSTGTPPPADTQAPTTPTNLSAAAVSSSQINLSWTASTDNVGVAGYRIYRGGSQIGTATTNSYSDTGLSANATYSYTVAAYDAAGNVSLQSSLASATTQAAPPPPPPSSNLIASYSFNENSGTNATDSSGNSRNGTLTNGPTWTTGKYSSAINFDGVNDNVTLPTSLDISALPFTVEAWINPANYSDWHAIFTKRSSYSAPAMRFDIGLSITSGNIYLLQPNSNLTFSYAPPLNTWTHIAIVADSTGTKLYVNGTLNQTLGTFTLGSGASAPAMIGNNGDADDPFAGKIDEVRVYTKALSQSEIQTDMNTPIGSTPPTPDTQAPTTPTNLTAIAISSYQINLSWTASSDNVGVTGYKIYRGGTQVGTSAFNSYSDTGLSPSTAYSYTVQAYDAAGNNSTQSNSASATTQAGSPLSYGLEWPGNGSVRRMLYWSNPFPIYDATYIFKVYPRKKTVPTNSPTGYYTTFFWGNNGNFVWDGGSCNTYYGAHPYPIPAPNGPGQWEISVYCSDPVTGSEVQWDRWYTQAFRVWRESSLITHHEFYYDLPDTSKVLTYTVNSSSWANKNPPNPAIVIGQAPNYSGASWGGYPGWEEFNGIIRGIQIYSNDLSLADIQSEINSPKSTTVGQNSIWYLNLDPRPTDVSDKKAIGTIHNPSWDGTTALEWSSAAAPDTVPPQAPSGVSIS